MLITHQAARERRPNSRRGAILIVVLALLALFAVIGIAFVYYAGAEAEVARIYKNGQSSGASPAASTQIDSQSATAVDSFLSSWIYDVGDSGNDLINAVRGHSVAATMYGRIARPAISTSGTVTTAAVPNASMFSGVGTFHEQIQSTLFSGVADRAQFINYTAFQAGGVDVVLDPEWTGSLRTGGPLANIPNLNPNPTPGKANPNNLGGRTYVPKNAPYTYPDLNNFFLSSISPATGEVLVPSFYRPWLFNQSNTSANTNVNDPLKFPTRLAQWNPSDPVLSKNTDWITASGRAKILRPRPIDQLTQAEIQGVGLPFPLPADPTTLAFPSQVVLFNLITSKIASKDIIPYPPQNIDGTFSGDVQNLSGEVGSIRNDSILLDLGLPTFTYTSPTFGGGTQTLKPLVSVLVRDLEQAVNLSVAGNLTAQTSPANTAPTHGSYSGFGPWEINPNQILTDTVTNATNEANALVASRYGTNFTTKGNLVTFDGSSSLPFDIASGIPFVTPIPNAVSGIRIGESSLVNWNGGGFIPIVKAPATQPVAIEAPDITYANQFQVGPSFGGTGLPGKFVYDGINNTAAVDKATNHPGLFNPGDWALPAPNRPLTANPFPYSLSDLKHMIYRYGDTVENYSETTFDRIQIRQTQLVAPIGTTTATSSAIYSTSSAYRTSLSHTKRLLFTTYSQTPDSPGIVANFDQIMSGQTLTLPGQTGGAAGPHAFWPVPTNTFTGQFPNAFPNPMPLPPNPAGIPTRPTTVSTTPPIVTTAMIGPIGPAAGSLSDFAGPNSTQNARAAIGGIDLNRPLADYRDLVNHPNDLNGLPNSNFNNKGVLTPQPLSGSNIANFAQAWADRQNLARDIFARLIVATGAAAFVNTSTGDVTSPVIQFQNGATTITLTANGSSITLTQQEYNALRYLAQIAVNIVDYIDKDDISTPFIWNPVDASGNPLPLTVTSASQITTLASNNIQTTQLANITPATTQMQNSVVFGVERPRLVINESYAEITNDPNEWSPQGQQPATMKAQVRFWVELLNPTGTAYQGGTDGMLGQGAAPLSLTFTPFPSMSLSAPITYNPYSLVITQTNTTQANPATGASQNLKDPTNVTGDVNLAVNPVTPNVVFNFFGSNPVPANAPASVPVNNGQYSSGKNQGQTPGFVVLGPQNPPGAKPTIQFNPTGNPFQATPPSTTNFYIQSGAISQLTQSNAMGYQVPAVPDPGNANTPTTPPAAAVLDNYSVPGIEQHVVVLRRLANPYLPPNDPSLGAINSALPVNPFISVDYMDNVRAFDAVIRGGGKHDTSNRTPKSQAPKTVPNPGYDPLTQNQNAPPRSAMGRVQPYAGLTDVTTLPKSGQTPPIEATYPQTFAITQNPRTPVANEPLHTFFRHNGRNAGDAAQPAPAAETMVQHPTTGAGAAAVALSDTLMAPFDWLVHLDRQLINQSELLHVQAVKPHEVTQFTLQPPEFVTAISGKLAPNGIPPFKDVGVVPWLGVGQAGATIAGSGVSATGLPAAFDTTVINRRVVGTGRPVFNFTAIGAKNSTATANTTGNGLFRALDVLRVKPWGYGLPVGGRVPGKINLNTIQDPRVLLALLDPQGANGFTAAEVDALWTMYFTGSGADWNNLNTNFRRGPNAEVLPFSRTANSTSRPLANGSTGSAVAPAMQWTTNVPVPGMTIDDANPFDATIWSTPKRPNQNVLPPWYLLDRPFKGFGVGEFAAPPTAFPTNGTGANTLNGIVAGGGNGLAAPLLYGAAPPATANPFGPGIQDTILRMGVPTNAPIGNPRPTATPFTPGLGIGSPLLNVQYAVPAANQPATPQATTYKQSEMLRKLYNNTTTVSNTFAVNMTIVFVKVRPGGKNTAAIPQDLLGPEWWDTVPGDLRRQYFAVVDRTNLALTPGSTLPSRQPSQSVTPGQLVTNLGNCYMATNTGTTAALPALGPTSQGPGLITDGTVKWFFFGPAGPQLSQPSQLSGPFTSALAVAPVPVPSAAKATSFALFLTNSTITPSSNPPTLTVMRDGNPIVISAGTALALGTGASQELVLVTSVSTSAPTATPANAPFLSVIPLNPTSPLIPTATPPVALTFTHYTGEAVSNAIPGYNGPHPTTSTGGAFDACQSYPNSQFQTVVPYVVKIQ